MLGARGAGPPPQFFTHVYFVNIAQNIKLLGGTFLLVLGIGTLGF